jgi:ABC-2 type transport system ATP-binding protein
MKRKAALLQVLVTHAPLLILDEPTNTLDPTMRAELLDQLSHARAQGQAVLFSSHVLPEVEQICDRVGVLQRGRLVHLQPMATLREARLVQARFARPPAALPSLPGCHVRDGHNGQLALEVNGPLGPVLDWRARQPFEDLHVQPLGLAAIYHRYHGAEA